MAERPTELGIDAPAGTAPSPADLLAPSATMTHRVTDGRFSVGIGRRIASLQDVYGIPRATR